MCDSGLYLHTVRLAVRYPGSTLALAAFLLFAAQTAYGKFGHGVEFFPTANLPAPISAPELRSPCAVQPS
jgi:hypothetical protein